MSREVGSLRVLMLLCQRLGRTGSGTVVKELVCRGRSRGVSWGLVHGGYAQDEVELASYPRLAYARVVLFATEGEPAMLAMPVPGMSNVMPYPAIRFSDLLPEQRREYSAVWSGVVREAIDRFRPDVIHVHHLWLLLEALPQDLKTPLVVSVHGTDLDRAEELPELRRAVERRIGSVDLLLSPSRVTSRRLCQATVRMTPWRH